MNASKTGDPTRIDEIADGIFRISTAVAPTAEFGGFTFNQFLVRDDEPLLFHTGPRKMFELTRTAIERVMPLVELRYVGFSHFEPDECGAMNEFLSVAPQAQPLCGQVAAMVVMEDYADRPPKVMGDGESLSLGRHAVEWIDAPNVPHGWDCGFLVEKSTRTLLCGDLFTQLGDKHEPLTGKDIFEPSEEARKMFDYFANGPATRPVLERLAKLKPGTLACMHGASFEGDGARLLQELSRRLHAH